VGRAHLPWEEDLDFNPSPEAVAEFANVAAAAYPEAPTGWVNIWIKVV
jgi:hypothetical protein